ncbi:MAG: SGNH/GDSL hydrolase family protein [Eubacteriales bacterium]
MSKLYVRTLQFLLIISIMVLSNAIAYQTINAKSESVVFQEPEVNTLSLKKIPSLDDIPRTETSASGTTTPVTVTAAPVSQTETIGISTNKDQLKQIPSLDDIPREEKRILFLGNSLTVGMANYGLGFEEVTGKNDYPSVVAYGEEYTHGFICETAVGLYAFLESYSEEIQEAVPYYDIVTINFGTNSLNTHTDTNLYTNDMYPLFLQLFSLLGEEIEIYVGTIPPVEVEGKNHLQSEAMSKAIRQIVSAHPNLNLLENSDFFGYSVSENPNLFDQGKLHLSVEGYKEWYSFHLKKL